MNSKEKLMEETPSLSNKHYRMLNTAAWYRYSVPERHIRQIPFSSASSLASLFLAMKVNNMLESSIRLGT